MRNTASCAPTRQGGVLAILHAVFDERDSVLVRELYHLACESVAGICPKAVDLPEETEIGALAHLAYPTPVTGVSARTTCRSAQTEDSSAAAAWCGSSRPGNR